MNSVMGKGRLPVFVGAGAAALGLSVAISSSCTNAPPARDPVAAPVSRAPQPAPSEVSTPETRSPSSTYADAIRRRRFARAAELIDQATETERKSPEVIYARAACALELDDVETTLRLADDLDKASPHFKQEAAGLRLDAAKASKDVTRLVHFLGASKSPSDQLLVAEAHEHSSSGREARKIADNVLIALQKSKRSDKTELSARARMIKARTLIGEDKKIEAAREYHWLATEGVALDEEGAFDEKVAALDPERALNSKERMARVIALSEKGLVEQTEAEIEALRKLSPSVGSAKATDHLLAWAVYVSRTDYERAAKLFASAAAHGGEDRRKHLYYEAKALARSHRDADAIAKYDAVAALGGSYADHATYQAARLRFIDGQWKEAVKAYEAYLKKFGRKAQHQSDAKSDLPIARLAADDFDKAYEELSALLKDEQSQKERARLMELQGVAKLGAKKPEVAAAIFQRVIDYRPLSMAALLAGARLKEMGQPQPPLIAPPLTLSDAQKVHAPLSLSLPDKVWRLSRVGLDEEAQTALQAEESNLRRQFGDRSGEALCRLYGQLESAKRRYQIAQTAASWSVLSRAPDPSTEWQWDCIYPTPYNKIVTEEAARHKIPAGFVYGVMRQESAFRPSVVSPAQAVGLMQIIPPTAKKIAETLGTTYEADLMSAPSVNISFGSYYLRYLLDIFANRPELAAASYNAGPQAVTRWLRAGENLPLDIFLARIPYAETRNYVYQVMGNYARYAYRDNESKLPEVDLKIPPGLKAPEDAY